MSETPIINPRVEEVVNAFTPLIRDRAFRGAIDGLSVKVLELCDEFFEQHAATILKHCRDADASDVVSAVCGWIIGMPGGEATTEKREEVIVYHLMIASHIAAWSGENSGRYFDRSRQ